MSTPRAAALHVLLAIERGHTTLSSELDRAHRQLDDERDRALLVELTTGVLRWQAALDALLAQRSKRAIRDLDPVVRASLRLGAYQLEHLDRVPPHAIVHEAVDLVRQTAGEAATGFVNAVLRSLHRDRATLRLPANPGPGASRTDQLRYLSTTLSHPAWLVERWLDRFGFDLAAAWCTFNNRVPDVTIRPRGADSSAALLDQLREAGVEAQPARFAPGALQLAAGALGRLPPTLRDRIVVQDEGSQLVAHAVGVQPGERVLDVCASPGGKTMILSGAAGATGLVVACDFRPARVRLLRQTLARNDVQTPIVQLDAATPLPFLDVFDRVVIDAPCSGLGTLRRDPDVKWTRQPDDLARFAAEQREMLLHAAEVVAPGGALIYATCSSEPEENDDVVAAFLAARRDYSVVPVEWPHSWSGGVELMVEGGFLRTEPFRDSLDAYFAATLVRRRAA